MTKWYHLFNC